MTVTKKYDVSKDGTIVTVHSVDETGKVVGMPQNYTKDQVTAQVTRLQAQIDDLDTNILPLFV